MLRKGVLVALTGLVTMCLGETAAGEVAPNPPAAYPQATALPQAAVWRSAAPVLRRATVPVTIMSFNVCGGVCRRGEVRKTSAYAARMALRHKASIVLLQELCHSQFVRIRTLLKAEGYTGRFAAGTAAGVCDNHDKRYGKGFGVAVLVRGTTSGAVVKRLPTTPGVEGRVMLGTYATVGGRRTFVATLHLSPSAKAGLHRQLRTVAGSLASRAGRPVIVGGDFNALPDNAGLDPLYRRFIETDKLRHGAQPTFDIARRKIDYIFLSAGLFTRFRAVSILTAMSDHRVYIGSVRAPRP